MKDSSLTLRVVMAMSTSALLAVAGCWGQGETPTPPDVAPPTDPPANAQITPPKPAAPRVAYVPGTENQTPTGPLRHEVRHIDPSIERWRSEEISSTAAKLLDQLITAAIRQEKDFRDVAGASFWCGPLRPERTEVLHDAAFTVWKGEPPRPWETSREYKGPAGLVDAVTELMAPLAAAERVQHEFSVTAVGQKDGRTITDIRFEAAGRTPAGQMQLSADWKCIWQGADSSLRLASIDVTNYYESLAHAAGGTLYADVSEAALGKTKAWRQQLVWGVDHWAARVEAQVAPDITGMTGLAIGDVNGDGLDDLYLCAGRGLPNRLFVQEADGTVRDLSAEAGVDWMDASPCALLLDLDNDGDQDLVVAVGNSIRFHENDGQAKMEMKTSVDLESAPMSMAAADYDNDGRLDVYICGHTPSTESQRASPLGLPIPVYDANNGAANTLLRGAGDWKFENVTQAAGLDQNNRRFSYACSWEDYDNDGDQDLYVANDFGRNNLYRNDDGEFADVAADANAGDVAMSRSVSWADYDQNGRMDLYIGNLFSCEGKRVTHQSRFRAGQAETLEQLRRLASGSSLLANAGQSEFDDVSESARVNQAGWAWSSNFCDINNDGRDDLVVANGFVSGRQPSLASFFWRRIATQSPAAVGGEARRMEGYRNAWMAADRMLRGGQSWAGPERNRCFLNLDGAAFADVSSPAGVDFTDDARGIAMTDWDQDGDLDLWISNRTAPRVRLLLNNAGGKSIALRLQGTECNRDAIGARLELEFPSSEQKRIRTLRAGEGFLSQSSKWVYFGVGDAEQAARLRVRWPGGEVEEYENLKPGGRYEIVQGQPAAVDIAPRAAVELKATTPQVPSDTPYGRMALVSRPFMPLLECKGLDGEWTSVGGASQTRTLLTLWASWDPASMAELKHLAKSDFDLRLAEMNVVALTVDQAEAGEEAPAAAVAAAAQIKAPYPIVVANAGIIDSIDTLRRSMMNVDRPLPLPSSLLLDKAGRVCAIYTGRVNLKQVAEDARHLDASLTERRDRALPLAGRWSAEPAAANSFAVAQQFRENGDNDRALAYVRQLVDIGRNSRPGYEQLLPDQLFYLLGNLLEEKGQTADAKRAYKTVLQYDPQHADALRRMEELTQAP